MAAAFGRCRWLGPTPTPRRTCCSKKTSWLPAIKTFTREPQESARLGDQVRQIRRLEERQAFINAGLRPFVQFLSLAGLLLLWMVSSQLDAGALTPAGVVSFLHQANLLTRPLPMLAKVYGQVQVTR